LTRSARVVFKYLSANFASAMNINFWAIGAVAAAAQGVFLSVALFSKKENRLPNRLLGVLLLLLSVTLAEWAFWWTKLIEQVPGMKAVSYGFQLLYGPLLLLYFEATFERKTLNIKSLWHLLPFSILVFLLSPFYLRFFPKIAASLEWVPPLVRQWWFPVLVFAQMTAYGIWLSVRFRRHVRKNGELKRWSRWLLAAYWGIVLTFIFYRVSPWFGLTAQEWRYLVAASLTAFIYLVAWLGYIEPRVFAGMPLREAMNPVKYRHSALNSEHSTALFRRISDLLEQEKLYRDSELSLDFLAKKLNAQRHHVSQAINEQGGKSFSEFVNEYRVQEARQLLAATKKQEMNAIEVAYQVGFGTKNAFNLAFKKLTGMTPSAYRQANGKRV